MNDRMNGQIKGGRRKEAMLCVLCVRTTVVDWERNDANKVWIKTECDDAAAQHIHGAHITVRTYINTAHTYKQTTEKAEDATEWEMPNAQVENI